VRPWVLSVFDHSVEAGGHDELKSSRPAHEGYEWTNQIRSMTPQEIPMTLVAITFFAGYVLLLADALISLIGAPG
jgi:hypothetical protein